MTLGNRDSVYYFLPEVVVSAGIVGLLLASLARGRAPRAVAGALTLLTCVGGVVVTAATADGEARALFGGLVARDPFADFFTYLALAATAAVALLALRSRDAVDYRTGCREAHEFHALLLGAALGVQLMAGARDLLIAYLGLELVSIMSYVLAGFTAGVRRSSEAALKYIVYGGVASGAMLYGFSLLYGLAASTDLAAVRTAAAAAPAPIVLTAVVLSMAGLGYKIAAVPFHMWCPDVYEGAPTPVSAFLSVAPKAGGFALLLRFFAGAVPPEVAGRSPWELLLLTVAVATMTLGNLAALGQQSLKRMLAYSSVAHAGYLLLGVAAGAPAGHTAVLFYLGVYLFMNLTAFAVVAAVADRGGGDTVVEWNGLGYRQPLAALAMTVALLGLAGLPPTAGFVGKYYLFAALVERGRASGGAFYLAAVVAVLNSVVALYYYARVLRAMYLEHADGPRLALWPVHRALLAVLAAPVLGLGVYWTPLRALAEDALALWAR